MYRTHPRQQGSTLVLLCLAVLSATASEAQVIQAPPRVLQRQPDSDRLRQELTLEMDLLGGFDDNLSPEGQGGVFEFLPRPSGYTGFAATRIRYWIGRPERSIEVRGGGFVNAFRNIGLTPSYGGELELQGRTELGRRTEVNVGQNVRSAPFFALGAFNSLQPAVADAGAEVPDSSPMNAFSKIRSLALDTSASLRRRWTRRTTMDLSYNFNERTYEDGPAFDSRRHVGSLSYDRSIGRSSGLEASYRYSDFTSIDAEGNRPIEDHTLELGVRYGRDVSRRRRVEISGGAGAVYTATIDALTRQPRRFWGPSGYATARIDLARTWTLAADYRRAVSVLQGLTAQAFFTHAGSVRLGGLLTDRMDLAFAGLYSNGQAGGARDGPEPGRFETYAVTSQFRVLVTRWWSAVVSYSHYRYRLNSVASRTLGISPTSRNAVNVGFTVQVPLVGS